MAIDNDKLLFSSEWDIDHIFLQGEGTASLGASASTNVDIPHGKSYRPFAFVTFKDSGSSYWHPSGNNFQDVNVTWSSDTTNFRISLVNTVAASRTVTYRYYLIEE